MKVIQIYDNILFWSNNYYKIYKKINPDIVLHNAAKPNIFGGIICRILKIPVINNISGLGYILMNSSLKMKIVQLIYRFSQQKVTKIFFQNKQDYSLFINKRIVKKDQAVIIPGSGVDTARFNPSKKLKKQNDELLKFCFIGRLITDKGIYEYVEAAKMILKKNKNVKFYILGELYKSHPTSITKRELDSWKKENIITYLGKTDRVENVLGKFDCIILPSYREGMSRVLLESASMGIPIITTNVPGCKEIVDENQNGFLCKVKDPFDLADKIERFIKLEPERRKQMGVYGRKKIESEFDEEIVINTYIKTINDIITKK